MELIIDSETDDIAWEATNQQLLKLAEIKLKETLSDLEKNFYKKHFATALLNAGYFAKSHGDVPKALAFYKKSFDVFKETGFKTGMGHALNNMGMVYKYQGEIQMALEHLNNSLRIREEIGDKAGVATCLNNLARIFDEQGEHLKALEYFNKSRKYYEEAGDIQGVSVSLISIGFIYRTHGDPAISSSKEESKKAGMKKALEYYKTSMRIQDSIHDKQGLAISLNNIGVIYEKMGLLKEALRCFDNSLEINTMLDNKLGIAHSLHNIGWSYFIQKQRNKALPYLRKSLDLGNSLGFPETIRNASQALYELHKASGDHKNALLYFERFIQMRDSISNESTRKASIRQQLRQDYDKKAAADSVAHAKENDIKNAELAKQKVEIKAKRNQQYALFVGLFCVCVFGAFVYNRYRVTQKQKLIIEKQKHEVEEQKKLAEAKQQEVLDSIQYAHKIQLAQIPSEKRIEQILFKLQKYF